MPRTATRLGKQADSVFAPRPVSAAPPPATAEAGQDYIKTTIALTKDQMNWLVRLEADIRATTGASVSRTAMLRAAVDAICEAGIDLTHMTSEAEVKDALLAHLSRGKGKGK